MKDKFFLDTNIFIYSFDKSSSGKQDISKKLILEAVSSNLGVISYQVIQEFLNVCLTKFKVPLKISDAKEYTEKILYPMCDIFPSLEYYKNTIELKNKTGYSFYDSMIINAAINSKSRILYSEDLQHNQKIDSITIKNPFC